MSGINIIVEHFCREVGLGTLIASIIVITLMVSCAFWDVNRICESTSTKKLVIVCSVVIIAVYIYFQVNRYNTTHMEYTVTVDDNVSFNDFHEKYEIISVNGLEYRVKEK